jgi:photosystem II stability/assembly factor-like uncharacterized protein
MTKPKFLLEAAAVLAGAVIGGGLWYAHLYQVPPEAVAAQSVDASTGPLQKPAALVAAPTTAPLLAAVQAGQRIIAAGDHGVIVLSDDGGKTYRQARGVPTQAVLTSLSFVDPQLGWAAGHDGLILHTADGGDTWTIQRQDVNGDKPLFSIFFRDAQHGLAVGLFGSAVQTADGGNSWTPLTVESGEETDHHLYAIFGDAKPNLYIAGETGMIYRSTDAGASWSTVKTANPGSFWTGLQLRSGGLLAAGQRGHLFSSRDQGATWTELPSGTDQSLTGITQDAYSTILLTGLAGTILTSTDNGISFKAQTRPDRVPLNAALPHGDQPPLLFGDHGVVPPAS